MTCLAVWWCSISSGSEIVRFILELTSFIFPRLVPEIVSQLDKRAQVQGNYRVAL